MMQVKQKEIKGMIGRGYVVDLTYADDKLYNEVMTAEKWLDQIAYSAGVYGVTGKVYRGHITGKLYVIAGRTSALWMFP